MKVIPGKVRKRNADAFNEYAEAFNCAIDAFIQLDEVRAQGTPGAFVPHCCTPDFDI